MQIFCTGILLCLWAWNARKSGMGQKLTEPQTDETYIAVAAKKIVVQFRQDSGLFLLLFATQRVKNRK